MTIQPYRLLVTGPRDCSDHQLVHRVLHEEVALVAGKRPIILVHGACPSGVDKIADAWGWSMHELLNLGVERHPAMNHPTENFGSWPAAGPNRNEFMVTKGADKCVAFLAPCSKPFCQRPGNHWSHGTSNCMSQAKKAGIEVREVHLLAAAQV